MACRGSRALRFRAVALRARLRGELKVYAADEAASRLAARDRLPDDVRAAHPEGEAAPIAHSACLLNPVGRGFVESWHAGATRATRYPAPQVEAASAPLTPDLIDALVRGRAESGSDPALSPQGFGVVAKAWRPRLKLAGTYDAAWRAERWPYPPDDFDMAFWNGAHPAMQCRHLRGGETVTLLNLLPAGSPGVRRTRPDDASASLRLPALDMTLRLRNAVGGALFVTMPIDTLTLDLEAMTLSLVWRASIPSIDDQLSFLSMTKLGSTYYLASDYALHTFDGRTLSPLKPRVRRSPPTPFRVQAVDDVLFYFDYKQGVQRFDGQTWERIDIPPELLQRDFKGLKRPGP